MSSLPLKKSWSHHYDEEHEALIKGQSPRILLAKLHSIGLENGKPNSFGLRHPSLEA